MCQLCQFWMQHVSHEFPCSGLAVTVIVFINMGNCSMQSCGWLVVCIPTPTAGCPALLSAPSLPQNSWGPNWGSGNRGITMDSVTPNAAEVIGTNGLAGYFLVRKDCASTSSVKYGAVNMYGTSGVSPTCAP